MIQRVLTIYDNGFPTRITNIRCTQAVKTCCFCRVFFFHVIFHWYFRHVFSTCHFCTSQLSQQPETSYWADITLTKPGCVRYHLRPDPSRGISNYDSVTLAKVSAILSPPTIKYELRVSLLSRHCVRHDAKERTLSGQW